MLKTILKLDFETNDYMRSFFSWFPFITMNACLVYCDVGGKSTSTIFRIEYYAHVIF